jgi:hypothetical protein
MNIKPQKSLKAKSAKYTPREHQSICGTKRFHRLLEEFATFKSGDETLDQALVQ